MGEFRIWTEDEVDYIRSHPGMKDGELAEALGRSQRAVSVKRSKMGMTKPMSQIMVPAWVVQYIVDNHWMKTSQQLADEITEKGYRISAVNIRNRKAALHLKSFPEDHRQEDFFGDKCACGWNRGKPREEWMCPESIEKMKKSQFQKGHEPYNLIAVGEETVRQIYGTDEIYVKQEDGSFIQKKRIIANAEKGKLVVHVDGDSLNLDPDNLKVYDRTDVCTREMKRSEGVIRQLRIDVADLRKATSEMLERK